MPPIAEKTDNLVEARRRALKQHADAAAHASRRAKTPEERLAHAVVEKLLVDQIKNLHPEEVAA